MESNEVIIEGLLYRGVTGFTEVVHRSTYSIVRSRFITNNNFTIIIVMSILILKINTYLKYKLSNLYLYYIYIYIYIYLQ